MEGNMLRTNEWNSLQEYNLAVLDDDDYDYDDNEDDNYNKKD